MADNRLVTEESQPESSDVDILIGTDLIWSFTDYLTQITSRCGLRAISTKVGWVLTGPHELSTDNRKITTMLSLATIGATGIVAKTTERDFQLAAFWDVESVGVLDDPTDSTDVNMVNHQASIYQLPNGRFAGPLPWNDNRKLLPSNRPLAEGRVWSLLRQLRPNREILEGYDGEIRKLIQLEFVRIADPTTEPVTYLPHHPVIRHDKTTTKIRPVFDGSARVKGGLCINDCLETGPNLNPDLLAVLLKFRQHKIAWTADIQQAFLMVELEPCDSETLRFLWIDDINSPQPKIVELKWTRLPFGLNCSPYMLRAVIKKHLEHQQPSDRETIELIQDSLYVDDFITGASTIEQAKRVTKRAAQIFQDAGMTLRKWITNCKELREHLGTTEESPGEGLLAPVMHDNEEHKVLGVKWMPENDSFCFNPKPLVGMARAITDRVTKRQLSSLSSKIFDPMGLLAPVVLQFKMLFQQLWIRVANWDDPVPEDINTDWRAAMESLLHLQQLSIPRWTGALPEQPLELHIFCDASKKAYGTVVYLRRREEQSWHTTLLCSKTRVAPLVEPTLPRLELLGALLGTRLARFVLQALNNREIATNYWLDSQVALAWIKGDTNRLKQFVKNRVASIRQVSGGSQWRYCPTKENPADLASRGAPAVKLVDSRLWWEGPEWLRKDSVHWPTGRRELDEAESDALNQELKLKPAVAKLTTVAVVGEGPRVDWNLDRVATYQRLIGRTAYTLRAIDVMRKKRTRYTTTGRIALSAEECTRAELQVLRWVQADAYSEDTNRLCNRKPLGKSSTIARLNPQWDPTDRLIRVAARIEPALREQEIDPPILLPSKHPVVTMLIQHTHRLLHHAGVKTVVAEIRNRYWVSKARQQAKTTIGKCVTCRKLQAKAFDQIPAALPLARSTTGRPFKTTGVDFAGPLLVKCDRPRKADEPTQEPKKTYICLFTCATTRAVHLELVKDCHANTFLLALRRFASRRGKPDVIYSDNATTFECVNKHLDAYNTNDDLTEWSAIQQVRWRFSASLAPWWGGFWERMVRSVKDLLKRTIGKNCLTFDQLSTTLTEIESVINGRPLTYVTEEPEDPTPLTPNRLLHGFNVANSLGYREPDAEAPTSTRDGLVQQDSAQRKTLQHWWAKWQIEYLRDLESFHAKGKDRREIRLGELVTIYSPNTKRLLWQTGVVVEKVPGKDGRIRMARVRIANGNILDRAVQSLFPLEVQGEPPAGERSDEPPDPGPHNLDPHPEPPMPPVESPSGDSAGEDVGNGHLAITTETRRGRTVRLPARFRD